MIAMKCTKTLVYAGQRLNPGDRFFVKTDKDARVLTAIKKAERSVEAIKAPSVVTHIAEKILAKALSADMVAVTTPIVEEKILDVPPEVTTDLQETGVAGEDEQPLQQVAQEKEEEKTTPSTATPAAVPAPEPVVKSTRSKKGAAKQ